MVDTRMQSKKVVLMQVAFQFSSLSYAKRAKVGAVITRDRRIISQGWNGNPSGPDNILEDDKGMTRPSVIHAEANAICFAARTGIPLDGAEIYCTHSPCFECAKLIIQSGIRKVYYNFPYRQSAAIKFLTDNGVEIEQIELK